MGLVLRQKTENIFVQLLILTLKYRIRISGITQALYVIIKAFSSFLSCSITYAAYQGK